MAMSQLPTINNILGEVKILVSQGKKAEALALLETALAENPENIVLMLWYAGLTTDIERGIRLLERVLQLDPGNLAAQKGLAELRGRLASAPPSPTKSEPVQETQNILGQEMIQLASQTIWPFRGLNRPIDELMTARTITKKDLAWAAWNAQNSRVRWAAAVYLQKEIIQECQQDADSLKEVIWPFKDINRPLLDMLQDKVIKMSDLVYAIMNAKDVTIVQGAAVAGYLLLTGKITLSQSPQPKTVASPTEDAPSTPAAKAIARAKPKDTQKGPLVIVEGSGYLEHQRIDQAKKVVVIRRLGMALTILAILLAFGGMFIHWWMGLGIVLVVIAHSLINAMEKLKQEQENFAQGIEGEKAFVAKLSQHLNSDWTLFRNVDLPDHSGDLDAVLVGPQGVYLCEIKAYNFMCRNRGMEWEYRSFGRWKTLSKSPTRQAMRNAARLNDYLKQMLGHDVWIEPCIVWAGKSKLFLEKPRVKIWYLRQPEYWLKEIRTGKPLPPEQLSQILVSLRTLCSINRSQ
jgi:tetratricopeptide (TPR) repeat protein